MRPEEPSSYGLFSFFTSSKKSIVDRPRSALAMFTNPSPSISPSLLRKESEDRGDILNLLRRSSGADSRASNDSAASRLPDNALIGLSDIERQHIMGVMARSTRNTSPMTSRRCSSALQMLPEVDCISEAEKEHIQHILEKAESKTPFMINVPIKKQISSRTESTNSRVSSEGIDEEVEIEDYKKTTVGDPIVEVPSRAVTPRNNLRVVPPPIAISHPTPPHSAKTDTGSRHSSGSSAHSQFGFSTPSISGFKSFFDKAKTATETLVKEIKDEVIIPETEKEKPEPEKFQPIQSTGELTVEELEHIRKINEMAQFDEPVQPVAPVQERRKSSVVSGLKSMFGVGKQEEPAELSESEREHIRKMSLMAEKMNEEIKVEDSKPKPSGGFGFKNFFGKATQSVMQATDAVIKNVPHPKQSLGGLTQEELDQIANAAESAQQEARQDVTQEELDHIARIAAMAEVDLKRPISEWEEPELSQAEKDHIAKVTAMAAEDFNRPMLDIQPKLILPNSPAVFEEPELSQEEMNHIAKIAAMAAGEFSQPMLVPIPEEEKEHIARINAMEEEQFSSDVPAIRSIPVEPELTKEELIHIERIAAMAENDFNTFHPIPSQPPTTAFPTTVVSAEPELSQEEKDHIATIAAMASEEDFHVKNVVPPMPSEPELSQEEKDHIARIAAMAADEDFHTTTVSHPMPSYEPELSQEEKDHIARIAAMAAEDCYPPPFSATNPFVSTEPELTQEELDHIAKIAEMAAIDFSVPQPNVPIKSAEPELTQEELDHIARISAMASSESMIPVRRQEPELTQDELDHIAMITAMAEQKISDPLPASTRPLAPPPPSQQPDLTQEELDHIARIEQMADMDFTTPAAYFNPEEEEEEEEEEEPKTESASDATSGADQFDEQDSGSEAGSFNEDNDAPQVLTSGSSPDRVTSPAALDTTQELQQSLIMAQKVVSSSPSVDSMASRVSSEYDIRSIAEIRRESESDIGKWYEEQLSFMRQSIHDEEEDAGQEIPTDVEEFPLEYVEDQLQFLDGIAGESFHHQHQPTSSSAPFSFLDTVRSIGEECYGGDDEKRKNEDEEETKKKTKNSSREALGDGSETQRGESTQQTPIDSVLGSRMLKRPNFGFLSNIANDAINKAKEAGSQIQAAVPIKPSTSTSNIVNNNVFSNSKSTTSLGTTTAASKTIPSPHIDIPMDGLSEEERRQIMSVMAAADFDDSVNNAKPSRSVSSNIPSGMEDLSEEERQKIMSVMANAEMEMGPPFTVSSQLPTRSPSVMSTSMMSELPPGLEDLSEEERLKIMSVMAEADMQDVRQPMMVSRGPPPMPHSTSIPPGMEGLSEEERQKIMSVMANAEMDVSQSVISSRQPSRPPSVAIMQVPTIPSMPIVPPGLEGLSEEERQKITSVMAEAEFENSKSQVPSRQPSRSSSFARVPQPIPTVSTFQAMPMVPPGLEDLSEEERQKIMSVMMNAEEEESRSQLPSRQPSRSPSFVSIQQPIMSSIPPGLEDLSDAERQKIMSVMAEAEVQNLVPSRSPSSYSMIPAPVVPPGLDDLSEAEKQKIMSVMAKAEFVSQMVPSVSASQYSKPPPPPKMGQPNISMGLEDLSEADKGPIRSHSSTQIIPPGLEDLSEEERRKIMSVMANAEVEDTIRPTEQFLPRGHTGFAPTGIVNEDELFERESKQREESPTRESGYATSTSYERELTMGGSEERMDELLEDILRIREGARSRRDSRDEVLHRREEDPEVRTPEEVPAPAQIVSPTPPIEVPTKPSDDFDFTYSDSRFADIVKMQEEEEANSIQQRQVDEKPRMWETVFDGDESELPHQDFVFNDSTKKPSEFDFPKETDEVFENPSEIQRIRVTKNHDLDMDEIYDNVVATEVPASSVSRQPIQSSSKYKTMQRTPSKPPPIIKITAEEETKSDSDEESCSEEDDEYPDRAVAAPTAPAPSYEEVENERIRQEELGKEVLQQIQAFGEVANDEFDVQWARTTVGQTPSTSTQPVVTVPKRSDPIPIAPSQRSKEIEEERIRAEALEEEEFYRHGHNPFLESPDEDEVSINMEDVEYAEIAKMYESANQMMRRPGPVYTITEDESEDDGTLSNSESRMVAREKRLTNKKTADSLMAKYHTMKKVEAKPTTSSSTTATAKPAYVIMNLSDPKTSTRTTDSRTYYESANKVPPVEIKDPSKDIPPEISASIDKTMAEVDALLGQVYTNEKAKPNLLCFDQTKFHVPTSSTSTSTADDLILLKDANSTSPSFLLPLQSSVLGSQLDSVQNDNERNEHEITSPRGLKRSPGMLLPSSTSSSIFPIPSTAAESVGATIGATTASMFGGVNITDPSSTLDKLTNSYKWLQNIEVRSIFFFS
ncbi:LOW QUALITY PROTEIN: Protein CBR-TAG-199, partial [Caenorhabditis briggsae]